MAFKILRDGVTVPTVGLGMLQAQRSRSVMDMVLSSIRCGYRLFDTATTYENEHELGDALKVSNMNRNEYFVVSKVSGKGHGYNETKAEVRNGLKKLGLDFVDLYLIHSPNGGRNLDTWKSLTELKEEGKARSIGVSNFNVHHLQGLESANLPLPAVNQIELHPWLQQREVVQYCQEKGIELMAFCPLARCRKFDECHLLTEVSTKHRKTRAQILIRWSLQKGFICIPKSSNEKRQRDNIGVYDFSLDEEDMDKLDSLDCNFRVSNDTIKLPWEG